MAELATKLGNPRIAELIEKLRAENENGEISCIGAAIIRPDGQSQSSLVGAADTGTLLGSIEMLKVFVITEEIDSVDHRSSSRALHS